MISAMVSLAMVARIGVELPLDNGTSVCAMEAPVLASKLEPGNGTGARVSLQAAAANSHWNSR